MFIKTKKYLVFIGLMLVAGFFASCDGENGEDADEQHYAREDDYPDIIRLPLQYIDSTSGHKIAVRVAMPADEAGSPVKEKLPVLLVQSAYNLGLIYHLDGTAMIGMPDPFFIKKGYIMVSVDTIGTGVSEGGWEMLGKEEQSGFGDVVDWIKTQDWYNGKLGVVGGSYMAITALFTAQQRPDDVKAIYVAVPIGDAARGAVGIGGMFNVLMMKNWAALTHGVSAFNWFNEWQHPEHKEIIASATKRHIEQIDRYHFLTLEKALNDDPELIYYSDFWRTRSPLENMDKIKAPIFITGAVHDIFQRDAPMLYHSVAGRLDSRLIIFDGNHATSFGPAIKGTEATAPIKSLELQWLDAHLKGIDSGIEEIPPVTQFVKHYKDGSEQGFDISESWPHAKAKPERWYLNSENVLSQSMDPKKSAYQMEATDPIDFYYGKTFFDRLIESNVTFKDGSDCSMSYVQWSLGGPSILFPKDCYFDHSVVSANALNFTSDVMKEDYYINGPMQADLWISSNKTNAVLSVRVDEVEAGGKINPISNGLLLASMRAVDESRSMYVEGQMVQPYHFLTKEKESLLKPDEITKASIEVFPSSVLIRKGNRLRVSIAPSNQAQGVLSMERRAQVKDGVTSIHLSPDHSSSLVVLSVPLEELD